MREWLYRIFQRQDARWITQPRDLLHSERSPDLDRTREEGRQSHPSTQLIRISSCSTTSLVAFNEHAARTNIKIGTKNWGRSPERLPFLQKNQITTECRTPLAYLNSRFEFQPTKAFEKLSCAWRTRLWEAVRQAVMLNYENLISKSILCHFDLFPFDVRIEPQK